MKLYIVRCGQAASGGNAAEDAPLSAVGQEQARLLGARLSALGFRGVVLSSPCRRAMETAEAVAAGTGAVTEPFLPIRARGAQSPEEIAAMAEEVRARLREAGDGDVLLVTHRAIVGRLRAAFGLSHYRATKIANASVTVWDPATGENDVWDASFLPEELRTDGAVPFRRFYDEAEEDLRRAAAFAAEGGVTLHIGDTFTFHYDYYRRLIAAVRPAVIVHTGDIADEDKAGRIDGDRALWRRDVPKLLAAMRDSGARVVIQPGNNDLAGELPALAPFAEVVPRNTVLEFSGVPCCLCHEHHRITGNAAVYLYGHGTGGDDRTKDDNVREGRRYFNAMWGASLHDFAHDRHLVIGYPEW